MILGRPTNLILGAFTALLGAAVVILGVLPHPIIIPAAVVGAVTLAFGALVALIANQPPTLSPGDTYTTVTPKGQPNYVTTVATPPAADQPPVPVTAPPAP